MKQHYDYSTWGFLHSWEVVAAHSRFQPYQDPESGKVSKELGGMRTDILLRCPCNAVKTKTIKGEWTLAQLRGESIKSDEVNK
jgi:hypothetical protein